MAATKALRHVYAVYLTDLQAFHMHVATPASLTTADLIQVRRTPGAAPECAVVLGCRTNKGQAKADANTYMKEVAAYDQVEDLDSVLLAETQLVE